MRQALRKVVLVTGFLLALGVVSPTVCPNAEASYGWLDGLETIGISAGIGTVLGLSTIAFYDSPTSHIKNAFVGLGAGAIVGLGVAAYLLSTSSDDDEISPEEVLPPENRPNTKKPKVPENSGKSGKKPQTSIRFGGIPILFASAPVTQINHAQGPQWAVAMRVLELRF